MRRLRWWLFRLRASLWRRQRERDLAAEIQFHLDEESENAAEAGLSAAAARRRARRDFGNTTLVSEDTRRVWRWSAAERTLQDLRYACRILRRRPVFAATALLSLALAVGANTALFSIGNNLFLRPLPVARPHELVRLNDGSDNHRYSVYAELRRASRTLAALAMMTDPADLSEMPIDGRTRHEVTRIQLVSDNYFDVLGVQSIRGQVFHQSIDGTSGPVAVISHRFWQDAYGGDPSAVGSRIQRRNQVFTVVGIGPRDFVGAAIEAPIDVWLPFEYVVPLNSEDRTRGRWVQILGRLAPGQTRQLAEAEATAILGHPVMPVRFGPGATGFSRLRSGLARPIALLAAVVGLVLLITSANLANLALAGSAARHRELTLRRAIGASRGRIVAQLATEGAVLAVAGATGGFIIAPWLSGAVLGFLPPAQEPALFNLRFTPDVRMVAFVGGLVVLTTGLFGILPAFMATRRRGVLALQTGAAGDRTGRGWIGPSLVVVEVAMCMILLVVAGLFVRSVHNLRNQDAGYIEERLLVADVPLPGNSDDRRMALLDDLRRSVISLPGVDTVGFSDLGQLSGSGIEFNISVPGRSDVPGKESPLVFEQRISPGFLSAMGTVLIAGREFTDADVRAGTAVALVSEEFARRYLTLGLPVGQRFIRETGAIELSVIGVVKDSKWLNLRDDSPAMYDVPLRSFRPVARMVVRTSGDLPRLARAVADVGQAMDVSLSNVVPFRDIVNRTIVPERMVAQLSSAFAILGVLIACIGLYGLLAYAVVRRRREIGIRVAVGASPGMVEWMMLRESLTLVAAGAAIGIPAAIAITRLVSTMLFGLAPGDPLTIAIVTAALAATTCAAAYLPARRAAALDPARVLREE